MEKSGCVLRTLDVSIGRQRQRLNAFGDAGFKGVPEFSSDSTYIGGKPVGTRRILANRELAEKVPGDVALSKLRAASNVCCPMPRQV
jgi:hypothetical protein